MCDAGTPARQRAMCGCYTRRSVIAVLGVAAVVVAAWLVPSLEVIAFVAAGVASAVIVALARQRGGSGWIVHRYSPPVPEPAAAVQEAVPAQWWERARVGGSDGVQR